MNDDFLKVAKEAGKEAGKVILKYAGKKLQKNVKWGDKSNFVTAADLEAEKIIIKTISSSFPGHNILAEEVGRTNKGSKYTWVIDPLDGTTTFLAGLPYCAVSIGLLEENVPLIGVVNQALANSLYWAVRGKGAFLNNKRITVSKNGKLDKAVLGVDFGHKASRQHKYEAYIQPIMDKVRYLYSLESDAVMLGLIAQGLLDGLGSDAWVWDFLGGVMIVREAGGKVTDTKGREPDWTKDKERIEVVASNGLIHDAILKVLRR